MPTLREIDLVRASVPQAATFIDAARALFTVRVSAIAVLGDDERVVGAFTDDDLLRGLFPGYIEELRHTAFLHEGSDVLGATLQKARDELVERRMRRPVTVEIDSPDVHVAERFLHCPWGALAVTENERFVGMVDEIDFCQALMRRVGEV